MVKRARVNLGLLSLLVVVVGASGLAACGSDSSDGANKAGGAGESGEAGETAGGAHAGGGGKSGAGSGGKSGAGGGAGAGAGAHAGSAGSGEAGMNSAGDSAGGAGGSDEGMGGEAGTVAHWIVDPELKKLSPLPPLPVDPSNQYADNADAAVLGQRLFFDKRYSGALVIDSALGTAGETGKVACATCHLGPAMSDGRTPFTVTLGTDLHTRNAPALVNSSFYEWTNWGGRFAAQWELPLAVAENARTMNSTRLKLAHFMYDNYKDSYEALFGALPAALAPGAADAARFPATGKPGQAVWDATTTTMTDADKGAVNRIIVNYGKAIQAYMRKLVSRNAPFDQYVESGGGNLSESAIRGSLLFVGKAKCSSCHSGPFMTDNKFHNLGGLGTDDGRFTDAGALKASALNIDGAFSDKTDTGRLAGLTNPMTDLTTHDAFRTASLREVKDTAPYMHAGQLATLEAVVDFYDAGGGEPVSGSIKDSALTPLSLSVEEKADLVEFLKTLSGDPVPASLLVTVP
jgi:cytochrome c peroxidase